jgi:hypothetical protein
MRFSAAIHQIVAAEAAPAVLSVTVRDEEADFLPPEPALPLVQEPPPDLDQRVRLSGEW